MLWARQDNTPIVCCAAARGTTPRPTCVARIATTTTLHPTPTTTMGCGVRGGFEGCDEHLAAEQVRSRTRLAAQSEAHLSMPVSGGPGTNKGKATGPVADSESPEARPESDTGFQPVGRVAATANDGNTLLVEEAGRCCDEENSVGGSRGTGWKPVSRSEEAAELVANPVTGWKPVSLSQAVSAAEGRSFIPLDKEAEIVKKRRNLPHWEQGGCTYFVTFRLADALPQTRLRDLVEERTRWLQFHPKPWTPEVWGEYRKHFGDPVQKWLDAGYGSCVLRRAEVRKIVEDALRHFDGDRYELGEFVVMPNHVHVLVTPKERNTGFQPVLRDGDAAHDSALPQSTHSEPVDRNGNDANAAEGICEEAENSVEGRGEHRLEACVTFWALSEIVHSWKSFTANRINRILKRRGRLWMDENFDHSVRTVEQLEFFEQYIRENPAKAGLAERDTGFQPVLRDGEVLHDSALPQATDSEGMDRLRNEAEAAGEMREEPENSVGGRREHRLEACVTLGEHTLGACVAFILLFFGAFGAMQAGDTVGVSPGFVLDTRDANGTSVAVSGAFTLDTRAPSGQSGLGVSNAFTLDTTGALPVAVVFQQTGGAFGARSVGSITEKTFTITNNSGSQIFGSLSVTGSFSVIGSSAYNLAPGQTQTFTIRFSPSAAGTYTGYVTLSGGAGGSWQITATAYANPVVSTGAISGQITKGDGTPLNDYPVKAESSAANMFNSGGYLTKSGILAGTSGRYALSGLSPGTYHLTVTSLNSQLYGAEGVATVAAGQSATVNFELNSVPPVNQPPSSLSVQDTPVVLVRGTGTDDDWATEGDYWYDLTVDLEGNGFTRIWDCNNPEVGISNTSGQIGHFINGTQSIQTNADSLRLYIQAKARQYKNNVGYYPPQINLVGHSMGGLIIRCALKEGDHVQFNDPTTGKLVPIKVGKVVMLATPNAGSVAADYAVGFTLNPFKNLNCGIFQPSWPATHDLTTANIRNHFNGSHPWSPNVKLFLYAGTGGFYTLDWKLAAGDLILQELNVLLPAEQVDDGAVPQPSVAGVFHYRTLPFLTCVSVPSFNATPTVPLVTDQSIGAVYQDHSSMLKDWTTLDWVVAMLTGNGSAQPATMMTQALGPVTSGTAVQVTSAPMQLIVQSTKVLTSGSTIGVPVSSDAATTLRFQLLTSGTDVAFRLQDPAGGTIDSTTPQSNPNVQYTATLSGSSAMITCQIANPTVGAWTALIDGTGMTAPNEGYSLMAFADSNVALVPQTGPLFGLGQDVIVTSALADLTSSPPTPIQSATMTAVVQLPDGSTTALTLFDDGLHNDGAPGDGVYAAVLPSVQQAGGYSITYTATAQNSQGQSLQRMATGAFSVSTGNGNLLGDPVYSTLFTSGTVQADYVQVGCWVKPSLSGTYILSGQLVDTSGTMQFSDSESFTSDGSAATTVNLLFDLNKIRTAGGAGQFHIANLQLFEVNSAGTSWLDTYNGTSTFQIGPNVTRIPGNQTAEEGTSTTLSVAADSGAIAYQWQFNGAPIAGATNATLSIPVVMGAHAGAYSVVISNETGSAGTPPAILTVGAATTFAHWQQSRFTADQLGDSSVSGANADPMKTGIGNLLRYAFNTEPFADGRSVMPATTTEVSAADGKRHLTFAYRQRIINSDLSYSVEVSDNLGAWDGSGAQVEQVGAPTPTGDGVTQIVKVRVIAPMDGVVRKFIHLRVIKN